MPGQRRSALASALLAFGAALLAIAVVDWTAYELALHELFDHEDRRHGLMLGHPLRTHFWRPSYWYSLLEQTPDGAALLVVACAGLLAAWRARLGLALTSVAALCTYTAYALATSRAAWTATFVDIDGAPTRWLWPEYVHTLRMWEPISVLAIVSLLLTVLLAAITLVAVRTARHPRLVLTLAAPAVLAAAGLALLWIRYPLTGYRMRPDPWEAWVDHVALAAAPPAPALTRGSAERPSPRP